MHNYLNTITQGDCLGKNGMGNLAARSIDLILCDLPYGTTKNPWDSILPLPALWTEYKRLIKPNGVILLCAQTPFDKILGASNPKMLRYEWIWEKTNATGHLNAKKAPMKAHENILVFYDKLPTYNPQKTTGHERKRITAAASNKAKASGNYDAATQNNRTKDYDSTERYPRDVIRLKSDKQTSKLHPCQKPVSLMEYFILTYTNPGDLVLDNTIGSGSTAIAAINTGRDFIGFEKDAAIAEKARQRIADHLSSRTLLL